MSSLDEALSSPNTSQKTKAREKKTTSKVKQALSDCEAQIKNDLEDKLKLIDSQMGLIESKIKSKTTKPAIKPKLECNVSAHFPEKNTSFHVDTKVKERIVKPQNTPVIRKESLKVKHLIEPNNPTFTSFTIGKMEKIAVTITNIGNKPARFKLNSSKIICIPAITPLLASGISFTFYVCYKPENLSDFEEIIHAEGSDGSLTTFNVFAKLNVPRITEPKSLDFGTIKLGVRTNVSADYINSGYTGNVKLSLFPPTECICLTQSNLLVDRQGTFDFVIHSLEECEIRTNMVVGLENNSVTRIPIVCHFQREKVFINELDESKQEMLLSLPETNLGGESKTSFEVINGCDLLLGYYIKSGETIKVNPMEGVLAPRGKEQIAVTCKPNVEGAVKETLTIYSKNDSSTLCTMEIICQCKPVNIELVPPMIILNDNISKQLLTIPLTLRHDALIPLPFTTKSTCFNGSASLMPSLGTLYPSCDQELVFNLDPEYGIVDGVVEIAFETIDKTITLPFKTNCKVPEIFLNLSKSIICFPVVPVNQGQNESVELSNVCEFPVHWFIEKSPTCEFIPNQGILQSQDKINVTVNCTSETDCKISEMVSIYSTFDKVKPFVVALLQINAEFQVAEIQLLKTDFKVETYEEECVYESIEIANVKDVPASIELLPLSNLYVQVKLLHKDLVIPPRDKATIKLEISAKLKEEMVLDFPIRLLHYPDMKETLFVSLTLAPQRFSFNVNVLPGLLIETLTEIKRSNDILTTNKLDFSEIPLGSRAVRQIKITNPSKIGAPLALRVNTHYHIKQTSKHSNKNALNVGFTSKQGKEHAQHVKRQIQLTQGKTFTIRDEVGFAIVVPDTIDLKPLESKIVDIEVWNERLGQFNDDIIIKSRDQEKSIPITCIVTGNPLVAQVQNGNLVKCYSKQKTLRIQNTSNMRIKVFWRLYKRVEPAKDRPVRFEFDYWEFPKTGLIKSRIETNEFHEILGDNDSFYLSEMETLFQPHETKSIIIQMRDETVREGKLDGRIAILDNQELTKTQMEINLGLIFYSGDIEK